jgi:hypothetical protein
LVTLVVFLLIFIAVFVASVGWIIKAVVAMFRREKRPWLYWGAPLAVIAAVLSAREMLLWLVGFLVAVFNGGSGRG